MAHPLRQVLAEPKVLRLLNQDAASFRFPKGAVVTVTVEHWRPYVIVAPGGEGCQKVSGPVGAILAVIAQTLNFTCKVVSPPDAVWGSQLPNGSWTGMIGQVVRQEVDLALGPFGMIYSRTKAVDFSAFISLNARSILSRKGIPEINPWGFLFPLTGTVWGAVAAALVVVWLTTLLVGRRSGGSVSLRWAGEVFLQNVRVFLNQGLTGTVDGEGGLIILGSWVVVAAVVFWSYTGTLTSLLAVRYIPQPIQTIRNLLDDPSVTVITVPMTHFAEAISKIESGELRELHELDKVGRVIYETTDLHSMIEKYVRHGSYSIVDAAFSLDLLMADNFIKTKTCDLYKSRQRIFSTGTHLIMEKGNPLLPAIDYRIKVIVESGLFEHWMYNELLAYHSNCRYSPSIILVREPLSLANLWGLFVVLGTGLMLATNVFCLELNVPPNPTSKP
ncbi:glutamate receptor ionotropic, delta-1-like [Portunus trituberculatus]|uniref:glutamate receptor ionotropic, delta-1-like n=1 Tax=Portunus trituberculatus TaxID=210409 RepID=UPI001E1CED0F|nr:glutamate receptor ionotropic, delta-1-like [Portunus trituberculatus]